MSAPLVLAIALILDAVLGEPPRLWSRVSHPIVAIGRLIGWLDTRLNRGSARRLRGCLALAIVLVLVGAISIVPWFLPYGWVIEILAGAILLAHRSLIQHVSAVAEGLRQSLAEGRRSVGLIVGRDPDTLDEPAVARAAIESAAENFSDGVAAPAFWFAIAGLPGIALYKAINTADSMIGHRTERHLAFGWAAARLDDLVNLIPARLTGALFCFVGGGAQAAQTMIRDAGHHRSPNAGWPEAAMAASLGVALAGPRTYAGVGTIDDAYINADGRRAATAADIDAACILLWRAWAGIVAAALAAGLFTLL